MTNISVSSIKGKEQRKKKREIIDKNVWITLLGDVEKTQRLKSNINL